MTSQKRKQAAHDRNLRSLEVLLCDTKELMKKIRTYIGEFYIEHDRTPSTTEIAKYFGIARSTSQNYLVAMNERGLLSYQGGKLIVEKMEKLRPDRQQAPLVGSVPCGELTYEEENVECVTTLPTAIFGAGPFYILHASGNSMEDEGIEDGDLVVIRQDPDPKKGDLVIALDEENRNTLKKYGGRDRKTKKAILQYCNKAVYGEKQILVEDLVCQGIVSHVIKKK
ncbi:MAG: repressor LexA [Lachnospiraceae bacterium]|nr:repressor LexA [Lachnospiraceae bacterium]